MGGDGADGADTTCGRAGDGARAAAGRTACAWTYFPSLVSKAAIRSLTIVGFSGRARERVGSLPGGKRALTSVWSREVTFFPKFVGWGRKSEGGNAAVTRLTSCSSSAGLLRMPEAIRS